MACGPKGSEYLTLACIASGFSPPHVTIEWKGTSGRSVSVVTQYPAVQSHGSYTSISLVSVKAAERESYSCSVNNPPSEKKEVSFNKTDRPLDQSSVEVTLNPPKVRELFINSQAVLDCIVTGTERAAVEGADVTWKPSAKDATRQESQVTEYKGLFRKTSTLTLKQEHWFTEGKVQCSVKQKNSEKPAIEKSVSPNGKGLKVPTVVINTPPEEGSSEFVTLVCVVTGFTPRDVYVMWTVGNRSYEEGITSEPVWSDEGTFSVTSLFKVRAETWKSNSKVTCNVKHASKAKDTAPITKSVSRATETLNYNKEGEEEDELGSLWSTTSSFIILFLCTLIYSIFISLIKMKQ
ncbi:hypothetical protein SKAU_G00118690 [Synaphobranchus kaupii]|uniref:Ig-like domain-containing protein n=1 Tax=Synaphobranchus kaupii TaxID=118154 RepID=A0A9Q1FNW8_SYNKA|nr:hypothetical protein SKAU_G00118690 [Synaphobranchus kaupii]